MGGIELGSSGGAHSTRPRIDVRPKSRKVPSSATVDIAGWPREMTGKLVWSPDSFACEEDYILKLTHEEALEVRNALVHFNSLGLFGSQASPETFPLPTLGPKLLRVAVDIHRGKGFGVIRGIEPEHLSNEDNVIVFLGISSYIGNCIGRQDEDGNMLSHIRDAKRSQASQSERPTRYSTRASTFHTDTFCDVLALHTRNMADRFGRNILSSSWTVYNDLMARYPDVASLLAQPVWSFDSRGTFLPSNTRSLLYYQDGRIILNLAREPLLGLAGVPRPSHLPPLSSAQRAALDVVERVAAESQMTLDARRGDMLFVNNHGVLHSREAFEDAPRTSCPRYLVRLWLRNSALAWGLPPGPVRDGNSRIYGADGGRRAEDELGERWNVVDAPRVRFRLSERLTS